MTLFERGTRHLALTDSGRELLGHGPDRDERQIGHHQVARTTQVGRVDMAEVGLLVNGDTGIGPESLVELIAAHIDGDHLGRPFAAILDANPGDVALTMRGGEVLGYRVPTGQPNAGQVDLPGPGVLADCDPDDLEGAVRTRFGAELEVAATVATVKHAITHHRITLSAHAAAVSDPGALQWFSLAAETPWTTPARKVFQRAFRRSTAPEA